MKNVFSETLRESNEKRKRLYCMGLENALIKSKASDLKKHHIESYSARLEKVQEKKKAI